MSEGMKPCPDDSDDEVARKLQRYAELVEEKKKHVAKVEECERDHSDVIETWRVAKRETNRCESEMVSIIKWMKKGTPTE